MSREVQQKHGLSDDDVFKPDKAVGAYINETSELMHQQQGRSGAIDIITAASHDIEGGYNSTMYKDKKVGVTSGNLGKTARKNMANNVSGLDPNKESGTKYAQEYLMKLNEKWAKRKEESYDKFPASPIEATMNQGGKF